MSARPDDVHIDDLAAPRLPDALVESLPAVEDAAKSVVLTGEALMVEAERRSGLSDFGDERFRTGLGVLTRALDTEAGLSALGRVGVSEQLVQLLVNRLLIEDLVARHPEIEEVEITAPIVIAGLPRTGTTHLHNLMSADPGLRSLPYWESLEPVLAEPERPARGEPDPRIARAEERTSALDALLPYFKRMHEMTAWHSHEEIQLLAIDFSTMLFETMAVMPSWRDWYLTTDQTPSYRYLKRALQVLQWQRGGVRWVLKSPQHLEQFGPIVEVFPDATVVVTHRDPVSVTASLATMVAYTARLNLAVVDPMKVGAYWSERIESMLASCVRDRHLLSADRSIDVRFDEFMADDVAMVERIYELAAQPMTEQGRRDIEGFMDEHPRGRHGRIAYELADLGLSEVERREALRFYTDRFAVPAETVGSSAISRPR